MIFFIVTASLFNNCHIRQSQYVRGINKLKQIAQQLQLENYKIIIVENNGKRNTVLNTLGCEVYYTNNNFTQTKNKGNKELYDVLDTIKNYNINDTDFIVKMTGRYILNDDSEFMNTIKNLHTTNYECVIKYGAFYNPVNYKMNDCITGLIGMTCLYVKQIQKVNENECIEWNWAKVTHLIDNSKICLVNKLGINICPGCNNYFNV
jgi:hypothetical protein